MGSGPLGFAKGPRPLGFPKGPRILGFPKGPRPLEFPKGSQRGPGPGVPQGAQAPRVPWELKQIQENPTPATLFGFWFSVRFVGFLGKIRNSLRNCLRVFRGPKNVKNRRL